jgi:conserved oligomeric Golgi complex subunit 6
MCLFYRNRHCQDCVASTRRSVLVRRFIAALTKGGPNGFPRPIEVHAHDPLRYLGDMLAWVHQALATEKEIVTGLFGPSAAGRSTSASPSPSLTDPRPEDVDVELDPAEVLDRIFDGVVRPLKVPGLMYPHFAADLRMLWLRLFRFGWIKCC